MSAQLRCARLHLTDIDRDVDIPLDAADQLMAWMDDPHGSATFMLPPVVLDGEWMVLRVHWDDQ